MNCEKVRDMLDVFLSGGMSGEESRAVRRHLASCAACASRLSASDKIEILPALDDVIEPTENFAERFHAKLQLRKTAGVSVVPIRSRWVTSPLYWVLGEVGALAAILVAGVFLSRRPIDTAVPSDYMNDLSVAQNLNLLEDMAVINNLDLLENFEEIEQLTPSSENSPGQRSRQ